MESDWDGLRSHDFWPDRVTEHTIWWKCSVCGFQIHGDDAEDAVDFARIWYGSVGCCEEYVLYSMNSEIDSELHRLATMVERIHDE